MSQERPSLAGLRIDRSAAPRTQLSRSTLLLIAAVILIAAFSWWWLSRPKPVTVRTVAARELTSTSPATLLNATGYVTARREATVSSKVTGKILEVLVEEGTHVDKGEVLARLDASNTEASLRLAEAQYEAAKRSLAEIDAESE